MQPYVVPVAGARWAPHPHMQEPVTYSHGPYACGPYAAPLTHDLAAPCCAPFGPSLPPGYEAVHVEHFETLSQRLKAVLQNIKMQRAGFHAGQVGGSCGDAAWGSPAQPAPLARRLGGHPAGVAALELYPEIGLVGHPPGGAPELDSEVRQWSPGALTSAELGGRPAGGAAELEGSEARREMDLLRWHLADAGMEARGVSGHSCSRPSRRSSSQRHGGQREGGRVPGAAARSRSMCSSGCASPPGGGGHALHRGDSRASTADCTRSPGVEDRCSQTPQGRWPAGPGGRRSPQALETSAPSLGSVPESTRAVLESARGARRSARGPGRRSATEAILDAAANSSHRESTAAILAATESALAPAEDPLLASSCSDVTIYREIGASEALHIPGSVQLDDTAGVDRRRARAQLDDTAAGADRRGSSAPLDDTAAGAGADRRGSSAQLDDTAAGAGVDRIMAVLDAGVLHERADGHCAALEACMRRIEGRYGRAPA